MNIVTNYEALHMKSNLIKLEKSVKYFILHLNSELMKAAGKSFFKDLQLDLYYLIELGGKYKKQEDKFRNKYELLPEISLNRKNKRIEIKLQAPALVEWYGQVLNENLAKKIIDIYLEAVRFIANKVKPEDNFNRKEFGNILLNLKNSITSKYVDQIIYEQETTERQRYIEHALKLREERRASSVQKNKLIKNIYVFTFALISAKKSDKIPLARVLGGKYLEFNYTIEVLEPYAYRYVKIFCKVLRRKKLLSPNSKLYIIASTNKEDALLSVIRHNSTNFCIASFDYDTYATLSAEEKEKVVFDILCQGLRDYVEVDNLDSEIVEEAIKEVIAEDASNPLASGQNEQTKV